MGSVGISHRAYAWPARVHGLLTGRLIRIVDRFFDRIPLDPDKYDARFFVALAGVLTFTLLAYWTLTDYWDVQWFAGEDGVSEWWSVGTYLVSAAMLGLSGLYLRRLGHSRLSLFHLALTLAFVIVAMEEISWGQRLFGWSTPDSLSTVNQQDETTFHNVSGVTRAFPTLIFWSSTLALTGALIRAVLHRRKVITTADFALPSLVLIPALLMMMFWIAAGSSGVFNVPRMILTHFDLDPVGSEIPEVLIGLCVSLYAYGNLRRVSAFRNTKTTLTD